jgi:hypothetical protein
MSALHHIKDVRKLEGPAFFKIAYRLPAYEGAARHDLEGWLEDVSEAEQQERINAMPPLYEAGHVADMRDKEGRVREPQAERTLTAEELMAAGPAAPQLGELVPMFQVTKLED